MTITAFELARQTCRACEGGTPPLGDDEITSYLAALPDWRIEGSGIVRAFSFKNYYQTLAFINAVAWIAHRQDHHPDIAFSYKNCTVHYHTHAIGGLSINDFICAAQIDGLLVI